MFRENKKISLIIALTGIALLITTVDLLSFIFSIYTVCEFYNSFLYEIRFLLWSWLFTLLSAAGAIAATLYWKAGTRVFRSVVMLLSITTILFSLAELWMLIAVVSMKP